MPPTVSFRGVTRRFGTTTAVDALDLQLEPGRIYGLLGPNGSGKTTTIRMMLGLLAPDEGEVSLLGGPPDQQRRLRTGYVPEQRGLYEDISVQRHLAYMQELRGVGAAEARRSANDWLERLGLADRAKAKIKTLSKGMQQKVQVAMSLMHRPELLVLDEPYTGLDPLNQQIVEDAVEDLVAAGTTVILSTHQLAKAEKWVQGVAVIVGGRKVVDGELSALRRARRTGRLRVEFDGPPTWIDGPDVREVSLDQTGATIQLTEPDSRALLARAAASGVHVLRWEDELPSLHDIVLAEIRSRGGDASALEEVAA